MNPMQPLMDMLNDISKAFDAGALIPALSSVYVVIDTMSLLCVASNDRHTRNDFIGWVDKYLKADPGSEYQYNGLDVYAARCATLHSYGSVADLHSKPNPPLLFAYADNGPHRHNKGDSMAVISIAVLIRDLSAAMERFILDIMGDAAMRANVAARLPQLFNQIDLTPPTWRDRLRHWLITVINRLLG